LRPLIENYDFLTHANKIENSAAIKLRAKIFESTNLHRFNKDIANETLRQIIVGFMNNNPTMRPTGLIADFVENSGKNHGSHNSHAGPSAPARSCRSAFTL
jgi:hypothetical protein